MQDIRALHFFLPRASKKESSRASDLDDIYTLVLAGGGRNCQHTEMMMLSVTPAQRPPMTPLPATDGRGNGWD